MSDRDSGLDEWRPAYARRRKNKDVVFYTHFEEVLQKINPFGPYQIFCFLVILYAQIEWAGNITFMEVLGSLEPNWNCTKGQSWTTITAPTDDAKCQQIKQNCDDITGIRGSNEFFSVVASFKLVCDEKDKVKWIQVIQAVAALAGSLFGGHWGDFFGRKNIVFVSGQIIIIITSVMSIASQGWIAYATIQGVTAFLQGLLEVTTLTMMMEYTNNKFRVVMASSFQWPFAYMSMALIAFLTKDWQVYFVFLNLVVCPLTIAFMLFLESPRWLVADGQLDYACDVLNDIAHQRWNNTKARFTTNTISAIHKDEKKRFYNFYHLFSTWRLAKQSIMQMLSMFTYSVVSNTYMYTVQGMHDSPVMFTFYDGLFRLFTPFLIIFLDLKFQAFGRKIQFVGSLLCELILFGICLLLVCLGNSYDSPAVTVLVIIGTMINDCVFWINIVQITTQRYPTVIRCVAFGCLHSVKHIATIACLFILRPLLTSSWPAGAFVIPVALIGVTLILGLFLQPETKGKALMDQMVEANYGRLENELPRALIRLAAGHKVAQSENRKQLRIEMEAAEAAARAGKMTESPWVFKGEGEEEGSEIAEHPEGPPSNPSHVAHEHIELHNFDNEGYQADTDEDETESVHDSPHSPKSMSSAEASYRM